MSGKYREHRKYRMHGLRKSLICESDEDKRECQWENFIGKEATHVFTNYPSETDIFRRSYRRDWRPFGHTATSKFYHSTIDDEKFITEVREPVGIDVFTKNLLFGQLGVSPEIFAATYDANRRKYKILYKDFDFLDARAVPVKNKIDNFKKYLNDVGITLAEGHGESPKAVSSDGQIKLVILDNFELFSDANLDKFPSQTRDKLSAIGLPHWVFETQKDQFFHNRPDQVEEYQREMSVMSPEEFLENVRQNEIADATQAKNIIQRLGKIPKDIAEDLFWLAVQNNRVDLATVFSYLLLHPNSIKDNAGNTPLHYAVSNGLQEMIDKVLTKDLDSVNAVTKRNKAGVTPLDYALAKFRIDNNDKAALHSFLNLFAHANLPSHIDEIVRNVTNFESFLENFDIFRVDKSDEQIRNAGELVRNRIRNELRRRSQIRLQSSLKHIFSNRDLMSWIYALPYVDASEMLRRYKNQYPVIYDGWPSEVEEVERWPDQLQRAEDVLRQLPRISSDSSEEKEDWSCPICYESSVSPGDKRVWLSPCNHSFHLKCIEQAYAVDKRCPMCKEHIKGYYA